MEDSPPDVDAFPTIPDSPSSDISPQDSLNKCPEPSPRQASPDSDEYQDPAGTPAPEDREPEFPENFSHSGTHIVSPSYHVLNFSIADQYFLEALRWTTVARELNTLQPRTWLSATVIDYWLHLCVQSTGPPDITYASYDYLHGEMNENMCQHFRQHYHLPPDGPCPQRPVIGFLHVNIDPDAAITARNHYCTFHFNVSCRTLDVIGYNYTSNRSHSSVLSDDFSTCFIPICKRLYELHGWPDWDEETPSHITVYETNFEQNGYDCGPIACQVIEHIMLNGFHRRGRYWNKPALECGHHMRFRMGLEINQKIQDNIASFEALPTILTEQQLDNVFQQDWASCVFMKDDLITYWRYNPGQRFQVINQKLQREMQKCNACRTPNNHDQDPPPLQVHPARPVYPVSEQVPNVVVPTEGPQVPAISVHQPAPIEQGPVSAEVADDGSVAFSDIEKSENPAIANKGIHVQDFSQAQACRFPRPTPPKLPPLQLGGQLRLRNSDPQDPFDDYQERPTREEMEPIPHLALKWSGGDVVHVAGMLAKNPWMTHRDYGYRLEPDFAQAFHLGPPTMVMDHLMPVGLKHETKNLDEFLAFLEERTRFGRDGEEMGAGEMLAYARSVGSNDIFVTGRKENGNYVRINLERDHIIPNRIIMSVDIDSVIWVTRFPRFAKWLNIYMQPVIRKYAPIKKHNHVYIDVIYPPEEGKPNSTDMHARFKLSQVPHLFLGKVGEGNATANLYMHFPRMIHKHPHIRRFSNMVPWDLQGTLWEEVIIPAMRHVATPAELPYIGFNREELAFKAREKGEKRAEALYPFKPAQLTKFFEEINTIVSSIPWHCD